jgi:hypothetical protein
MNELRLPPRRALPPEVRGRIRARVLPRPVGRRRTRFLNSRGPFAVAAGVVMLAAGAMIVGQSVTGGPAGPSTQAPPTGTSGANRPLNVPKANAELDRCWAAIQAEGKAGRYPDRSRWRAVSSTSDDLWLRVTAAYADGKPIFCQTTVTTVRVSDPTDSPAYVAGSDTAALFISPEGIVAGVRDLSWAGVGVFTGDTSSTLGSSAELLPAGLFLGVVHERIRDTTKIEIDRWWDDRDRSAHPERIPLPRPAPALSRVDRPTPAKDRISERGLWLKQCLDNSRSPVLDADMWEPGAWATAGDVRYMFLRAGQSFAYCTTDSTRSDFALALGGANDLGKVRPQMNPGVVSFHPGQHFVSGALPDDVAKLEVVPHNHPPVTADLWNSTFVAVLTEAPDSTDLVRGFDAAGNKVYEGSLF